MKARKVAQEVLKRNSGLLIGIGVFLLLFALAGTSLSSCSAFIQGGGTTIVGTTYVSTDEDIYAVENAYKALETELQAQIDRMEREESGYDEYRYQIDEIGHNPYHLISYFTAKYGEFTYEQVADEVEEIFRAQYHLEAQSQQETVTETKTVRVGERLGEVVTSGYCNCTICCGQWSGGPTASGVYPTPNHTISTTIQRETKLFLGADNEETAELTVPMYDFGDWASRMKAYRKKNHITQQELAQLMGVKHFTLRSWEQKQAKPPYNVWRLHKHLFDDSIKLT